jgi:hypothetical protein
LKFTVLQTLKIPFAEIPGTLEQAGTVAARPSVARVQSREETNWSSITNLKSRLVSFYFQPSSVFNKRDRQPSAEAERSVRPKSDSIVLRFMIARRECYRARKTERVCPFPVQGGLTNRPAVVQSSDHPVSKRI